MKIILCVIILNNINRTPSNHVWKNGLYSYIRHSPHQSNHCIFIRSIYFLICKLHRLSTGEIISLSLKFTFIIEIKFDKRYYLNVNNKIGWLKYNMHLSYNSYMIKIYLLFMFSMFSWHGFVKFSKSKSVWFVIKKINMIIKQYKYIIIWRNYRSRLNCILQSFFLWMENFVFFKEYLFHPNKTELALKLFKKYALNVWCTAWLY